MCGWHSGIFSVGILGEGNIFVTSAPRQSLDRARVGHLVHAAAA